MARSSVSAFGGITKCRWSGSVGDEQPSSIGGHSLAGVVVVECDNDGCLPGLRHRDGRGTLLISHFRETYSSRKHGLTLLACCDPEYG